MKYQLSQRNLKEARSKLVSFQHCVEGLKKEVEALHGVSHHC